MASTQNQGKSGNADQIVDVKAQPVQIEPQKETQKSDRGALQLRSLPEYVRIERPIASNDLGDDSNLMGYLD
ncbi:hypothetical protein [Leptolyngbya sp. FACHB-261]|uniref:hypothetical protein n=1 Tax=Leptolyngbya sp. FACHB-261 TaxID=2692806 RepID=UPI0016832A4E|nr:hypothetical protein [Leptolyngbya sp. FACHB-261]